MSSPLISDRKPFLLLERCRITTSGSSVVAEKDEMKVNLPVRTTQLLILGNGTSITSEAMYICSKERCHIAQSKGGLSIHTVFHSGLYPNPSRLSKQVLLANNPLDKLRIARYIVIAKLKTLTIDASKEIDQIMESDNIFRILGIEGAITKKEYRELFGKSFSRSFEHPDQINSNMTILNSVFYSFITSVVCSLGYSPSIGFLHGHTRRGGLVFDIADMFKHNLYLTNLELLNSKKNLTREFSSILQSDKNKVVKEIIYQIEKVCTGDI